MAKGLNCRQHQDPDLLPAAMRTKHGVDPTIPALCCDIMLLLLRAPAAAERDGQLLLLLLRALCTLSDVAEHAAAAGRLLGAEQAVRLAEGVARCPAGAAWLPGSVKAALQHHALGYRLSSEQALRLLAAWSASGRRHPPCTPHALRALVACADLPSLRVSRRAEVLAQVVQLSPTFDLAPHLLSAAASVVER